MMTMNPHKQQRWKLFPSGKRVSHSLSSMYIVFPLSLFIYLQITFIYLLSLTFDTTLSSHQILACRRDTAFALSKQKETLENTQNILNEHEILLDRSNRTLRGMTWTGWVTNMLTQNVVPNVNNHKSFQKQSNLEDIQTDCPPSISLICKVEGMSLQNESFVFSVDVQNLLMCHYQLIHSQNYLLSSKRQRKQ